MAAPKGRGTGVPNYKNDVLLTIIEAILPNCSTEWDTVCKRYKIASGEKVDRDNHDIKRHFMIHKSLCDNNRKVTGSAAPKESVARSQAIFLRICRKGAAGSYGDGDEEESTSDSGDDKGSDEEDLAEQDIPAADIADRVAVALPANPVAAPEERAEERVAAVKKRKSIDSAESTKSKNSRNNARGGAGAALSNLAEVLTKKHSAPVTPSTEPNMMTMMMLQMQQQMQMQQQASAAQQQANEQSRVQQNQQFQMMLMMMGPRNQQPSRSPRRAYHDDAPVIYAPRSANSPVHPSNHSPHRFIDRFNEYPDRNS